MAKDARILTKIASWYYLDSMNQEEIARRTRLSRSTISRLLQRARDEGIVSINVNLPDMTEARLERRLEEVFDLKEAIVALKVDEGDQPAVLGRAAGAYLQRVIQPGDRIGIGWGEALWHMVHSLPTFAIRDVTLVQLTGALEASSDQTDAAEHVRVLAQRTGGRPYLLHAPFYVDSLRALASLESIPMIAETMGKWKELNLAVVSIGPLDVDACLIRHGASIAECARRGVGLGAVGEICGRLYDGGDRLDLPLPGHVPVSISLEQLQRVDHVVGVAGGANRIPAIIGALNQHLLDVLITDTATARTLLEEAEHANFADRKAQAAQ